MGSELEIFNFKYNGPDEEKAKWLRTARMLYDRVMLSKFDVSLGHKVHNVIFPGQGSIRFVEDTQYGKTLNVFINIQKKSVKRPFAEDRLEKHRYIIPMLDMGMESDGDIYGVHTWKTPAFEELGDYCELKDGGTFNSPHNGQHPFNLVRWSSNTVKHTLKDFVQQQRNMAEAMGVTEYAAADFVSGSLGNWVWSGTVEYPHYWALPNGATVLHRSTTWTISWSVTEWVTADGGWYTGHQIASDYRLDLSGQIVTVLADSYIEDTGDYAILYSEGTYVPYWETTAGSEGEIVLWESELPWLHDWTLLWHPIPDASSGLITMNYGLYILTCIDGVTKTYDLDIHWDSLDVMYGGSSWEIINGFINLYKEGVVVYSYTVTPKESLG